MTPITVEGKTLFVVEALPTFTCPNCQAPECVRVDKKTKELYFETKERFGGPDTLYCINQEIDIVFIKNTPKSIAKYVAAKLEAAS